MSGAPAALELPRWRHYSQEDPLDERVQEQILLGISTRDYPDSLERLPVPLVETVEVPGVTSAPAKDAAVVTKH